MTAKYMAGQTVRGKVYINGVYLVLDLKIVKIWTGMVGSLWWKRQTTKYFVEYEYIVYSEGAKISRTGAEWIEESKLWTI